MKHGWNTDQSDEPSFHPDREGCTATVVHEMDAIRVDDVSRTESGWARMLHAVDHFLG